MEIEERELVALERARGLLGQEFDDKETPQPEIDRGLAHRFLEAVNRSTRQFKESGTRPFSLDDVPLCVLSQFGTGVWGPFKPKLDGYAGYLFGQIDTEFSGRLEYGQQVSARRWIDTVDAVHGKRVRSMIRFRVAVEHRDGHGAKLGRSTLTLLRLSAHGKEDEVQVS